MHKKKFSTANLSLAVPFLILVFTYFYLTIDNLITSPIFCGIILFIIVVGFLTVLILKILLYVYDDKKTLINKNFYDSFYMQNLSWYKCFLYCIFTAEPSKFISLFSGAKLSLYKKGRICKFCWENNPVRFKHRILDIILMVIMSAISFFIAVALTYHHWGISTVIFVVFLFFAFRKHLINYCLSINVGIFNNCKINVIFPYSTSRISFYKYYGMAIPFNNTILISEDAYRLNPIIKEYVLSHEKGHLNKKSHIIIQYTCSIIALLCFAFLPDLLTDMNYEKTVYLILPLYLVYSSTLGYFLRLKAELFADNKAVEELGKEKVLKALIIIKDEVKEDNRSFLSRLFFRSIPIERRIRFINEINKKL